MQTITQISQEEKVKLVFNKKMTIRRTIQLARKNGLNGRFQIEKISHYKNKKIIYSFYYINERNKIISQIFPMCMVQKNQKNTNIISS